MASSILNEYKYFLNWSIWPIHGTVTPSQSGHGSNSNKDVFNTCQISSTGASPSVAV